MLTVSFELAGVAFTALNGGPVFRFNEAVSLQVMGDTQEEVDHFWSELGEGGDPPRSSAAGSRTASGCPGR